MVKLWLGTAQFGRDYGISNVTGKIARATAERTLERARAVGIDTLDTAPAYGVSETLLGELGAGSRFRIITKTRQFRADTVGPQHAELVISDLDASLEALRLSRVNAVLVHIPSDVLVPGGERIYDALLAAKAAGRTEMVGVSAYDPDETLTILDRYPVDLVQIPLNIFDQRFVQSGFLEICHRRGIPVHCRSAFLQGLLLMEPDAVPAKLASAKSHLAALRTAAQTSGRSMVEICLAYIASVPGLEAVVCGVAGLEQFEEIVRALAQGPKEGFDFARFLVDDPVVIDPRRW